MTKDKEIEELSKVIKEGCRVVGVENLSLFIIGAGYSRHPASGLTEAFKRMEYILNTKETISGDKPCDTARLEMIQHIIDDVRSKPASELPWKEAYSKQFRRHYEGILSEETIQKSLQWNLEFMGTYMRTPELPSVEELLRIIATVKGEQSNRDIAQAILSYLEDRNKGATP